MYNFFTVVTCAALSLPNGQISYNKPVVSNGRYPVDTTFSFTYNHGYRRTGSASRSCQTSGNWTQQSSTCIQSKRMNKILFFIIYNTFQKPRIAKY